MNRVVILTCSGIIAAMTAFALVLTVAELHYVYFDRDNMPDLGPFTRFEFPTTGHIYDAVDRPLIELAAGAPRALAVPGHSTDCP